MLNRKDCKKRKLLFTVIVCYKNDTYGHTSLYIFVFIYIWQQKDTKNKSLHIKIITKATMMVSSH